MRKLISLTDRVKIYARDGGWHYHLNLNCPMLVGRDFERLHYIIITKKQIKARHLRPCSCAYEGYEPPKLINAVPSLPKSSLPSLSASAEKTLGE